MTTFPSQEPAGHDSLGGGANLFTRFKVSADITITDLFFSAPTNLNNVTATLWKGDVALAQEFMVLVEAGLQVFHLDTPIDVTAVDGQLDIGICVPVSLHYTFVPDLDPIVEGSVYQEEGNQFGAALADPAVPHGYVASGANAGQTFFGVGFMYTGGADPLFPLAFVASRVSDSSMRLDWDDTDPTITEGIRILRAPGVEVNDADDNIPGSPTYDPSGLPGAIELADGVMASPYSDDPLPAAGTYTYWIQRMP